MQNLRARPYDPRTGRFVGLDPFRGNMQDPQSLHKYAYVHGDPIGGTDPTGLMTLGQSLGVLGAVGAIIGLNMTLGRSLQNMKVELSLNTSHSRNRQITRDYATLYLRNPRLFKWAGMAAFVSNQVGLILMQDNTAFEQFAQHVPRALTVPNLRDLKIALARGNQDIYQDLYWQHVEFLNGGISAIRVAANQGRINQLQLDGWEKIHLGDVTYNGDLIWEGNKLLLENEQKVVLQPIFDEYASEIDELDTFGYQLHHAPGRRAAQLTGLVPGTKPAIPRTPFFRDAVPGGKLSNSSDRWNWIENSMLPAFEMFEGTSSMRTQIGEMTRFPVPVEVFR